MIKVRDTINLFKNEYGAELYDQIPSALRILLSTDGTVTDILEAYYSTNIEVEKIKAIYYDTKTRVVILRHYNSKVPLLYAVSNIKSIDDKHIPIIANELMNTDITIGRFIDDNKLRTRRVINKISFVSPNRSDYKLISKTMKVGGRDLFIERYYDIIVEEEFIVSINEIFNIKQYERGI